MTGTGSTVVDLAGLASVATPVVVAAIVQSHWSKRIKEILACSVAAVAGALAVFQSGDIDFTNFAVVIPAVLIASQVVYHAALKPLGLAPWFEQLTNLSRFFPAPVEEEGDVSQN